MPMQTQHQVRQVVLAFIAGVLITLLLATSPSAVAQTATPSSGIMQDMVEW